MNMSEKDKIGKCVLMGGIVIVLCIAAAIIGSLLIPGTVALQTGDTVKVTVNAPAYVEETFDASIDVDGITDFNAGQFDLAFTSSVVNVSDVTDGRIDGTTIPVDGWEFMDKGRIRVILDLPEITGVSGSGNLAKIRFEVVGKEGDTSVLRIANGLLVNNTAGKIPANWHDAEISVGTSTLPSTPTPSPTLTPTPVASQASATPPTPTPTPKPAVPGFDAILAIAGMIAIAFILLSRK